MYIKFIDFARQNRLFQLLKKQSQTAKFHTKQKIKHEEQQWAVTQKLWRTDLSLCTAILIEMFYPIKSQTDNLQKLWPGQNYSMKK